MASLNGRGLGSTYVGISLVQVQASQALIHRFLIDRALIHRSGGCKHPEQHPEGRAENVRRVCGNMSAQRARSVFAVFCDCEEAPRVIGGPRVDRAKAIDRGGFVP